jgi:hypothetical protein
MHHVLRRLPAAALFASGLAGVLIPADFIDNIELDARSPRGLAEARAGLGGTYAGLGAVGVVAGTRSVDVAIGATWLGAGVVRAGAWQRERFPAHWTYWSYLGGEFVLGGLAVSSAIGRSSRARAR